MLLGGLPPRLRVFRLERAGLLLLLLRPRLPCLRRLLLLGGLPPACCLLLGGLPPRLRVFRLECAGLLLRLLLPALHLLLAAGHLRLLLLHLFHVQLVAQDAQVRVDAGSPAKRREVACVQLVEPPGGRDEHAQVQIAPFDRRDAERVLLLRRLLERLPEALLLRRLLERLPEALLLRLLLVVRLLPLLHVADHVADAAHALLGDIADAAHALLGGVAYLLHETASLLEGGGPPGVLRLDGPHRGAHALDGREQPHAILGAVPIECVHAGERAHAHLVERDGLAALHGVHLLDDGFAHRAHHALAHLVAHALVGGDGPRQLVDEAQGGRIRAHLLGGKRVKVGGRGFQRPLVGWRRHAHLRGHHGLVLVGLHPFARRAVAHDGALPVLGLEEQRERPRPRRLAGIDLDFRHLPFVGQRGAEHRLACQGVFDLASRVAFAHRRKRPFRAERANGKHFGTVHRVLLSTRGGQMPFICPNPSS